MTAAGTPATAEHHPTVVHDLTRRVHAELFKLRATPSMWLLAALAATAALAALVPTLLLQPTRTAEDVRSLLSFSGAGGLMVILLGLVVTAGEYRHGTITPTAPFVAGAVWLGYATVIQIAAFLNARRRKLP